MPRFELNVYGENDEILKTYATEKPVMEHLKKP